MSLIGLLGIPLLTAFIILLIPWPRQVTRSIFIAGGSLSAIAGWLLVFQSDFKSGIFELDQNLMMDSVSAIFVLLIVTVGFLSNVYASGYLFKEGAGELSLGKLRRYSFFFYIFLFTMLLTVL